MKNNTEINECFGPSQELLDLIEFCNNLLKLHSKLPIAIKDKLQTLVRRVESNL